TVRALFFNPPARRKFLRAQATETRAVVEAVTLLALTRPETAFTLASDERTLIDVRPAASAIERVAALWGGALADTLLPIAHREGPLEVRGFAQRPAQAKPTGRKGYVFVRGRPRRVWGLGLGGLGIVEPRGGARGVVRGPPSPESRAPNPASASSFRHLHPVPVRLRRGDCGPALGARTRTIRGRDAPAHGR